MRYPSHVVEPRPKAPGVGPFVIDQTDCKPWSGYLVDQNGRRVLGFNVAPGEATGCRPSDCRKRLEWLLHAVNSAWNTEQSIAAIGRSFSGEKA